MGLIIQSQNFDFFTVLPDDLALGHILVFSLLSTPAVRSHSLYWVSPSLRILLSPGWIVSDKERLMYYHIAFDLKLAYLLNLFSTGLLKRIIYSNHRAKMSPLALIEIKEHFA